MGPANAPAPFFQNPVSNDTRSVRGAPGMMLLLLCAVG
jgi:hypothetical protein